MVAEKRDNSKGFNLWDSKGRAVLVDIHIGFYTVYVERKDVFEKTNEWFKNHFHKLKHSHAARMGMAGKNFFR